MKIKPFGINLSLVFSLLALTACNNDYTPENTALIFCNYTKAGRDDIPHERLTMQLIEDIKAAEKTNSKFVEAEPSDKPPLGDGLQFQANQDTAIECEVRTISRSDETVTAEIRHIFPDEPQSSWSDFLVMKKEDAKWKIDNVLFTKPDSDHNLRSTLKIISEMTPP